VLAIGYYDKMKESEKPTSNGKVGDCCNMCIWAWYKIKVKVYHTEWLASNYQCMDTGAEESQKGW